MKKNILTKIKLILPAGSAVPSPNIGSKLGPSGINLLEFCKIYNEKTKDNKGLLVTVIIKVFKDNSYKIKIKSPSTISLIKNSVGFIKRLTTENINYIIRKKKLDFKTLNFFQIKKIILGTAESMGIKSE